MVRAAGRGHPRPFPTRAIGTGNGRRVQATLTGGGERPGPPALDDSGWKAWGLLILNRPVELLVDATQHMGHPPGGGMTQGGRDQSGAQAVMPR